MNLALLGDYFLRFFGFLSFWGFGLSGAQSRFCGLCAECEFLSEVALSLL